MDKSVAIIGLGGRFPEAATLPQFYRNLQRGLDSVRPLAPDRIAHSTLDPGKDYQVCGHLDRVDTFDHAFFAIARREAELMDPMHRLLLELSCEAIEHAGYSLAALNGSATAVYFGGKSFPAYYELLQGEKDPAVVTGNLGTMAAGRVAYLLNLNGPAMMIDTACSSSLVAVHEACGQLLGGEVDYALAGGVNVRISFAEKNLPGDALGVTAADGKSKTFDAAANGTGVGEGGGVVLLKRLSQALADGDTIHAVIRGCAVNHDGSRSNGMTAPSPAAQTEVIKKAWKKAGVDPATITYIEAHGTGTRLGDPIEFQAISDAFRAFTPQKHFCALSTVKTNIGHLDNAAGIAGLLKAVLSLKHGELLPSLHFRSPNPFIDFTNTAAYVNTDLKKWETPGTPRRCGVSSFGLSGTNAHVVLEEAPPRAAPRPATGPVLLTLSARSLPALQAYAEAVYAYLRDTDTPPAQVAYTLNTGRNDYEYRMAVAATTRAELLEKWRAAQDALAAREGKAPARREIVLLLSGEAIPDGCMTRLADRHPAFGRAVREVKDCLQCNRLTGSVATFAGQYGLFRLCESLGLVIKTTIATGAGKITKRVIAGALRLCDAVEILRKSTDWNTPVDVAKLKAGVRGLAGSGNPLFVEAGSAAGTLGATLRGWAGECGDLAVHALLDGPESSLYDTLAALYTAGVPVDWPAFYAGTPYPKVTLPTYPFAKTRCWAREMHPVPAAPAVPAANAASWCYGLRWQVRPDSFAPATLPLRPATWLVVRQAGGDEALAAQLGARLEAAGGTCLHVSLGDAYRALSPTRYTLPAAEESCYHALAARLESQYAIGGILLLAAPGAGAEITPDRAGELTEGLTSQVYAPFLLAKAFHGSLSRKGCRFGLLTRNAQAVAPADAPDLLAGLPVTLLKALRSEYPLLEVSSVDVGRDEPVAEQIQALLAQLADPAPVRFAARRDGRWYQPQLTRLPAAAPTPSFRTGGAYLVTGGASGIGLAVAGHLARHYRARLLILATQPLPERAQWAGLPATHPAAGRVQALRALEDLGAAVEYYAVDVADAAALAGVMARIGATCPRLDGVIHAAGVRGGGHAVAETPLPDLARTLRPKVQGSLWLEYYCRPLSPGFFVCFSSLGALVPVKHRADYTLANAFEDSFCTHFARQGRRFQSLAWPVWQQIGMAARQEGPPAPDGDHALRTMAPEDGLAAFDYALGLPEAHVAIADLDLGRIAGNPFFAVTLPPGGPAVRPTVEQVKARSAEALTDTQAAVMAIWQEVLKADALLLADDFFEIGGHSLNGTQVLNRLEKDFGVSLELDDLLEHGTVEALAALLDDRTSAETPAGAPACHNIPTVPAQARYPASHAQQRLWVLEQLHPGNAAYHLPGAYRLEKDLDRSAFSRAFGAVVARHESLRTVFGDEEGQVCQRVLPPETAGFALAYGDLQADPEREETARQLARQEAATPFDLAAGPLLRARLLHLAPASYVFLFTMHHIISDGWSMGVLLKEVLALYDAFRQEKESPLAPLPIQYRDYAAWQHAQLGGPAAEAHRQYWRRQLGGTLPLLDLPLDFPRPAARTNRGARLPFRLDGELAAQLRAFSGREGVSVFMTLLASVYALLYRYTGQEDLVIGSPIAGRDHADLEGQIGLFVNLLALRVQLAADETFTGLLQKVKTVALGAYQHQVYPFDQLVETLSLPYDPSRHPLFDVMVVLQNTESRGGLAGVEVFAAESTVSQADLKFDVTPSGDGYAVWLDYNPDLFSRPRMERLAANYQHLLGAVLRRGGEAIGRIAYLPETETRKLLVNLAGPRMPYPADQTLADRFEAQAARTPDAPAVLFETETLTYRQLNERANQLAHYLRRTQGLRPGDRAGILLERSGWMVAGLLGILKAGAAYVPIDPDYPAERIAYLLADSATRVVITQPELSGYLGETTPRVDLPATAALRQEPTGNPDRTGGATDLAYVIYTSGSTGNPKGVEITHRNAAGFLHWCEREFDAAAFDVVFAGTSYCFDLSVFELFYPLGIGKPLRVLRSGLEIGAWLDGHRNILLNTVPSVIDGLVRERADFSNVTVLNMAGEPIPYALKEAIDYRRIQVRNLYGPSEDTTYSSCYRFVEHHPVIPIGKPLANTQFYIVDQYLQLLPEGVPGEICIGGDGLAKGYLNQPGLTAQKFVPNPFRPGERMYRTGDVGRWLPDGNVEYLGRNDHQVKIRGYRIELGEIESKVLQHPAVRQVVVAAHETGPGDKRLVAYLVGGGTDLADALRLFLRDLLPAYMIPAQFVVLDALPLTPNGKIDRKALPKPGTDGAPAAVRVAPADSTEAQLVAIWEEVLGRPGIGVTDNFFELGGHSLKAVRVASRIGRAMGTTVALRTLFVLPTIRELARHVSQAGAAAYTRITPLPGQPYYDLSHAQRRLWLLDQMGAGRTAFNMPGAYRLTGNLDVPAFARALHTLAERHESLRTVFVTVAGVPRQRVRPVAEAGFRLECLDLRGEEAREATTATIVREEAARPFDLGRGPLLRARLLRVADAEYVFLLTLHHIISDGWSMGVLLREALALYGAYARGEKNPLAPLPIQYRDFAAWQHAQAESERVRAQAHYWQAQLGGDIPVLELPADHPRPAAKSFRGGSVPFVLDGELTTGLHALGGPHGTSLFMTLLASVYALLYRYSGQTDVVLGAPISGRDHADVEGQVGLFVNMLALRTRLEPEASFGQLLDRVKAQTLAAYAHAEYPFDRVVQDLRLDPAPDRSPLFDVVVQMQDPQQSVLPQDQLAGGVQLAPYPSAHHASKFDLTFNFLEAGGEIQADLEYSTDLFNAGTARGLAAELAELLRLVVRSPHLSLKELKRQLADRRGAGAAYAAYVNTDLSADF